MTLFYDLLYLLAVCLGWPLLILRRLRRGPGSIALAERLGNVPPRRGAGPCLWIHGVSLGEINAARTLVRELRQRRPQTAIAVSSTTNTGLARAREIYPDLTVFRFPLDFSPVLRRVFDRLRPSVLVLMELETWPNLIELAAARRVPVMIANGRVTEEHSMRRFRWPILRQAARRMFGRIAWVGAQDETYAARFCELGVPAERIRVVGSLKYDAADVLDEVPGSAELASDVGIVRERPLIVAGSSGPGEEAILLDCFAALRDAHPHLQLALVPRRPERFDEVAALIERHGFACVRRSRAANHGRAPSSGQPPPVVLGDTMGELRKFYGLATVIFVGRTLIPQGGSDVMEAAALAKPLIVGPHVENFAEPVRVLCESNACLRIADAQELTQALDRLLRDAGRRDAMGRAARQAILQRRGATAQTVAAILSQAGLD